MAQKRLRIYVSGPYRGKKDGEILGNINRADEIGREIALRGHTPFVPHTMLDPWRNKDPHFTHERIAEIDEDWLDACDALFYIGSSPGADKELAYAKEKNKIIFTNIEDIPSV